MRRVAVLSLIAATGCVFATDFDSFHDPSAISAEGGTAQSPTLTDAGAEASTANDDGGPTGTDGGTEPTSALPFSDDFNRADGPVGNGWIEGQMGLYAIANGGVPLNGNNNFAFQKTYLYRPASDDARDIAASVEFTPSSVPPNYPQVHVRRSLGDDPKCYAVGIPSTSTFFWGRCGPNNQFDAIQEKNLTEPIAVGKTYRLTIAASGTDPVHLALKVERLDGANAVTIGTGITDDSDAKRVTTTGLFGISADTSPKFVYDNFVAKAVSP